MKLNKIMLFALLATATQAVVSVPISLKTHNHDYTIDIDDNTTTAEVYNTMEDLTGDLVRYIIQGSQIWPNDDTKAISLNPAEAATPLRCVTKHLNQERFAWIDAVYREGRDRDLDWLKTSVIKKSVSQEELGALWARLEGLSIEAQIKELENYLAILSLD